MTNYYMSTTRTNVHNELESALRSSVLMAFNFLHSVAVCAVNAILHTTRVVILSIFPTNKLFQFWNANWLLQCIGHWFICILVTVKVHLTLFKFQFQHSTHLPTIIQKFLSIIRKPSLPKSCSAVTFVEIQFACTSVSFFSAIFLQMTFTAVVPSPCLRWFLSVCSASKLPMSCCRHHAASSPFLWNIPALGFLAIVFDKNFTDPSEWYGQFVLILCAHSEVKVLIS